MSGDPEILDRQLGVYRVESVLGRGGMGEVFLAWDERLKRHVAIKRIRDDYLRDRRHRLRFRREARAVARLSHSAIVQVFDIFDSDGGECIVMEYVEGKSFAELLSGGPIELARAIQLALEIADGLAEAHDKGLVHRDLKPGNVLLTPAGRAKILDFGLARMESPQADDTWAADTLTEPGALVGTVNAMSPEQATGQPVDHRSDLFALGGLIYHMVTGQAPFDGKNLLSTLWQISNEEPVPIRELEPRVPVELADLVGRLLAKQPDDRPQSTREVVAELEQIAAQMSGFVPLSRVRAPSSPQAAQEVQYLDVPTIAPGDPAAGELRETPARGIRRLAPALALVVLVLGIGFWAVVSRSPPAGDAAAMRVVAVPAPAVRGDAADEDLELLAYTVRNGLVRALTSFERLSPVSTEEVDAVSGTPTAIARAVTAEEVLTSTLGCRRLDCSVELRRVRGHDGGIERSARIEVPRRDLLTAARAVAVGLRRVYPEESLRPDQFELEVSPDDFRELMEIRRTFESRPESKTLPDLITRLEALRGRSPRFVETHLLEAEIVFYLYRNTFEEVLLERAMERIEEAQRVAPESPEVLFIRCYIELNGGKLDAAEETLATLARLVPGDVRILDWRAQLEERRGFKAEGLKLAGAALDRRPSWQRLYRHAAMAFRQGEVALARQSLEHLLEQHPAHIQGTSLLARIELVSGDPQRAVELYSDLIDRAPTPLRLTNLGLADMLLGDYASSAATFERALAEAPNNPFVLLNLADARALAGHAEEAEVIYRKIEGLIDEDSDDPSLLTVMAQALAHLGDRRRAVAAIQRAARLAPESSSIAFESAVVYAVVGDHTAAEVSALNAVELGYDPRWFRLPWFDGLRNHVDFVRVTARHRQDC